MLSPSASLAPTLRPRATACAAPPTSACFWLLSPRGCAVACGKRLPAALTRPVPRPVGRRWQLSILSQMPAVEVLSLSINNVKSLKYFQRCDKLRELYLRRNEVEDIAELGYLTGLTDLRVLWLSHNPIASTPNYRATVLRALPSLTKLDDTDVTAEEVAAAREGGSEIAPIPAAPADGEAGGDTEEFGGGAAGAGGAETGTDAGAAALQAIKLLLPLLSGEQLEDLTAAVEAAAER